MKKKISIWSNSISQRTRNNTCALNMQDELMKGESVFKIIVAAFLTCFQCLIQKELTHRGTKVSSLSN